MRHGDMPAAFITMISESVLSLLSVWPTAITSAIGAITSTSIGMSRPVMPMNTRTVWPWLVIRSISRSACVSQMTAVRLTQHQQERAERGAENVAVDRTHMAGRSPSSPATQRPPTHRNKTLSAGSMARPGQAPRKPRRAMRLWEAPEISRFCAPDAHFLDAL